MIIGDLEGSGSSPCPIRANQGFAKGEELFSFHDLTFSLVSFTDIDIGAIEL